MKFVAGEPNINERSWKVSFFTFDSRTIIIISIIATAVVVFSVIRREGFFERDIDVEKGLNSRDLIKFDVVRTKEVSLSSLQTQPAFFPGKSY